MFASGIKCIRVQLGNGPDRYSAVSMRRRLVCPAYLQRGAPQPFDLCLIDGWSVQNKDIFISYMRHKSFVS